MMKLLFAAAAVGGAGYALSLYGRYAVKRELAEFGPEMAGDVASSMTTLDALKSGARKLVGQNALPYGGTAVVDVSAANRARDAYNLAE